jgi:pimeloyl-ACP methyl ester carboxylesterase
VPDDSDSRTAECRQRKREPIVIPKVGEQFRQFRILSKVGEGGMGVVLRAHDTRLGRDVALKFLTHLGSVDSEEAGRMRLEARSLAALNHGNIVTIYDIDEVEGAPFLVLEWVPGTSLAGAAVPRPCSEDEFLRIGLPIAESLAAAHTRKIVHRDLKPGNVLLAEDGGVKLVDFGLAKFRDGQLKLTKTATVMGTAGYMSPEQASGGEVGTASDVFSFGVLAYELLTDQLPFEGDSFPAMLYSIVHTPHVPLLTRRPDLSTALTAVVERCLQKRPEDRYSGAAELAQDLHRVARSRNAEKSMDHARSMRGPGANASGSPEIRYCRTAVGASIAYAVHGSGPILVRVLGWFTHLEMEWEWPALRLIWERLGETHTVVRYDGRGIGLSSPWTEEFSEETRQLDLDAVLNAIGADKVALYGISEGGWTAAHYASFHPERVSHLIIYGSYSRGARFRPDFDAEETRALEVLMRKGWGRDTPQYRQIFTTAYFGADADPGLVAHFNHLQRAAADGDTAARYQESLHRRDDAREVFANIRVPTLVVHCRDDLIVAFEEGRLIASLIPGAQFLPFPTGTHYFPVDDEVTHKMAEAIHRFTG